MRARRCRKPWWIFGGEKIWVVVLLRMGSERICICMNVRLSVMRDDVEFIDSSSTICKQLVLPNGVNPEANTRWILSFLTSIQLSVPSGLRQGWNNCNFFRGQEIED